MPADKTVSSRVGLMIAAGCAGASLICAGIVAAAVMLVISSTSRPPRFQSADEAWRALEGVWSSELASVNSKARTYYEFTADRQMIFGSSLQGGVLPAPMTNRIVQRVAEVRLEGDGIGLMLQDSPGGRIVGPMTVRFISKQQIVVEDSEPFTRK